MKLITVSLFNLLLALTFFLSLLALEGCGMGGANVAENEPLGIHISAGIIHSRGYGVSRKDEPVDTGILTAREAAYNIALSNLLEYVQGVQLESKTKVKDTKLDENEVSKSVRGTLKNVLIFKEGVVQIKKKQVVYFVEIGINSKTVESK